MVQISGKPLGPRGVILPPENGTSKPSPETAEARWPDGPMARWPGRKRGKLPDISHVAASCSIEVGGEKLEDHVKQKGGVLGRVVGFLLRSFSRLRPPKRATSRQTNTCDGKGKTTRQGSLKETTSPL